MEKIRKIFLFLMAVCMAAGLLAGPVSAEAQKSGWVEEREYDSESGLKYWAYYDEDGTKHTGWLKLGSRWYYFLGSGEMVPAPEGSWSHTILENGRVYFFDDNGVWQHTPGWMQFGYGYYYIESNGTVAVGWKQIDGKWYYLDDIYNISGSGRISSGRATGGLNCGRMISGTVIKLIHNPMEDTYDGIYSLDASGAMVANGWNYNYSNDVYCGRMEPGWLYHGADGRAVNGWSRIGGSWYYFIDHIMQTGWVNDGSNWYYLKSSGAMQTGWVKDGGNWYYLKSSGAMQTGWVKDGSSWYYMNSEGIMQTGWQRIGGKWYYMNSGGAMQTGWQKISGKWYYFTAGGVMVTGTQVIDGKTYTFNESGVWIK